MSNATSPDALPLTAAFNSATPSRPGDARAFEAQLADFVARARAAWPDVALATELFVRHAAERVKTDEPVEAALARLNPVDLFIACACAEGEPRALALFEQRFLNDACAVTMQVDPSADFQQELRQLLRERLLVGEKRIVQYRGQGSLGGWVRTAALRVALNLRERARVHQAAVEVLAHDERLPLDRDLDLLKRRYAGDVAAALRQALTRLPAETKHLLRLHYVHGLALDKIGKLFKVNKSTVSRRLGNARQTLLSDVKRQLAEQLGIADESLESLLGVLGRTLEISLSGLMAEE